MKKIFGIILFLIAFAFSADVRPFVFDSVSTDLETQQEQWETLVKYKLWGTIGINLDNEGSLAIEEQNGYTGTAKGNLNIEKEHHLGGPIIVGGKLTIGTTSQLTNVQLTGGPVRADTIRVPNWAAGQMSNSIFDGPYCVKSDIMNDGLAYDFTVETLKSKITSGYYVGDNYDQCPQEVPLVDTTLRVPTVNLDSVSQWEDGINLSPTGEDIVIGYIHVPPDSIYTNEYGTVDKFITKLKVAKVPSFRIYVVMPPTGRLTRIFVKDGFELDNSAHYPRIQVMYVPEGNQWNKSTNQWDLTNVKDSTKFTYVEEYQGNLLFYTDKKVDWASTDHPNYQGTFITKDTLRIGNDFSVSGQLIAKYIYIRTPYLGKFKYVPFDPPVIDIDPTALASGKFIENDTDVQLPISLDVKPITNVTFNYCYLVKDETASAKDFNNTVPICGSDSGEVKILKGTQKPIVSPILNVKIDGIDEGDERLILYIFNLNGAVMPNKQLSGYFNLTLTDGNTLVVDTTKTYSVDENISNVDIGIINIFGKNDATRISLTDTSIYRVDNLTGIITLKTSRDYETKQYDTITVVVKDTALVDTGKIIIRIVDVNEAPTLNDVSIDLKENNDITKSIDTLIAIDVDTTSEFTQNIFSLLEGDTSIFRLDTAGELWAKKTFDYETDQKTYTLKVLVQDKNVPTLKDSAIITVNIINSNDGPKFDKNDITFNIDENLPFKDSVKVTDQDDGDVLIYTIIDNVPFKIDNNTGIITSTRTFDYETEIGFTFKVVVYDGTLKDTMNVKVLVNDVNEQLFVDDASFDIDEGKVDTLGKINAWDDDGPKDTIKFTCDDTVHYHIDSLSGVITLLEPFNYETQKYDILTVYVNTKNGDKDSAKIIININNVNEPPVLQPNDTLHVDENCDSCFVGIITVIDPDEKDTLFYDVKEPEFKIDSTGKLTTTKPFDHETTPTVTITVVVKDSSGATDTKKYVITITDVNEPVHIEENTCKVKENYTGKICTIVGYDEDIPSTVIFDISDKTKYDIDDNGVISVIKPFDFETVDKDSVKVYVIDTRDSTIKDSAWIKIIVENVKEKVNITEWDHNPPPDTVKTNNPDHEFKWTVCEIDSVTRDSSCTTHYDNPTIHKDTVIKVCNENKTVCDSVVILFNDAPPVVTLTNAKSTDALIDYITIEEQKDDKIYVNKKNNEITVTVKDTVHKTEKHFNIDVTLDTIATKDIKLTEYNYIIDETKAKVVPIGNNLAELVEVIKVDGIEVELKQVIDMKTGKPVDTVQTVTYTKKVGGKNVVVSYKIDNLSGQKITDYEVSYMIDSCTKVTYSVDDNKKIVKNKEGNIAYTIAYEYTDDYGNKASANVEIIFDNIPPKVEILNPIAMESFNTNAIPVKWTVNGEVQDTLTLQRLEKGINHIIRRYVDKAGNVAEDTITVIMREAKDIEIELVQPVTMVDKDKVDAYYSEGHKYNDKKPYDVKFVDPKNDTLPDVIGVGFKIDIVLPSVSPTGSLATLDDITKNGQIPVDDNGNIVGASTHGIPVDQYVEEHCTEEFQKDYQKYGLNIPLYDVKYNLHLWVYTNAANYVNDFNIEFTLNDEAKTTSAGTVQMVIDWLADRDGTVKAKNKHALGTGAYLTKLYSKSIAKHRCDYKEQRKGDKTVKKDETMKTFGFKRPNKK